MAIKCSVIIPVYNGERYINETVASVLNQTFKDFELIIVDDCSTDGSFEILEKLADLDGRIQLLKNENNKGVAHTRNRGIEEARGKYVALLDSDDIWFPEKLEKQISFMEVKGCRLSYCSYGFVDRESNVLGKNFCVPIQIDLDHLLKRNVISCSTVIGERGLFLKHKFNQAYYHEDFIEWIDMMEECKNVYGISKELARIRIMSGTRSAGKKNSAKQRWRVYRKYLEMNPFRAAYYFLNYTIFSMVKYWTLRKGLVK